MSRNEITPADKVANARAMTDDELAEFVCCMGQVYGDILIEHQSETALYGDSWPGAQLQLGGMSETLAIYEAEMVRRNPAPPAPPAPVDDDDEDVPF